LKAKTQPAAHLTISSVIAMYAKLLLYFLETELKLTCESQTNHLFFDHQRKLVWLPQVSNASSFIYYPLHTQGHSCIRVSSL